MIPGEGPNSRLMIVADSPSKDDSVFNKLFSNKSEGLLNRMLRGTGYKLDDLYRTSVTKHHDPRFTMRNKKEVKAAVAEWAAHKKAYEVLRDEIKQISPNAIVAMGELSLQMLTGKRSIDKYRGSVTELDPLRYDNPNVKVVPTYPVNRMWQEYSSQAFIPLDFAKAGKLSFSPYPHKLLESIWIARGYDSLREWWSRHKRADFITVDIEGWWNSVTCVGLSGSDTEAVAVPLFFGLNTPADRVYIWKLLRDIFQSPVPKINQNIKFDNFWLKRMGLGMHEIAGDPGMLFHVCYPEFPKNLGFQCSIFTDRPYHKDEGSGYTAIEPSEDMLIYCAKDALSTRLVWNGLVKEAKELRCWDFYSNKIWPLFHHYTKMEDRGIRVDEERRQKLISQYQAFAERCQTEIEDFIGHPINIRSSKQVGELVYRELGLPEMTHVTEAGETVLSTDKETLEELYVTRASEAQQAVLGKVVLGRKLLTILNYLHVIVSPDGRLRGTYNLNGTKSGRSAMSSYYIRDYKIIANTNGTISFDWEDHGCSLQVLPKREFEAEVFEGQVFGKDIPTMFVASPGHVFVEGDGKAAEAYVVAVCAADFETIELMNKKVFKKNTYGVKDDIHTLTAMLTMKLAFEQVRKYHRDRYGKIPRHAGNYDMTAYRLAVMLHCTMSEAQAILDAFHAGVPKIRTVFHEVVRQAINTTGRLVTPHGRHRDFFGRRSNDLYKEAYSMIPQGTVSDHTKFTIPLIADQIPEAHFLLEKHDSLLMEIKEDEWMRLAECFKKLYERPISFRQGTFKRDYDLIIPAELQIGENWGYMEEVLA